LVKPTLGRIVWARQFVEDEWSAAIVTRSSSEASGFRATIFQNGSSAQYNLFMEHEWEGQFWVWPIIQARGGDWGE